MLKNYIKIAFRNLWKHKVDSTISIGGLAVGLACCILLVLYVRFELSYDSFHEESNRVYKVIRKSVSMQTGRGESEVEEVTITSSPAPVGPLIGSTVPEVETVVRTNFSDVFVASGDRFDEWRALNTENSFLLAFTFPLLAGDLGTVLQTPDEVILSRELAERLFNTDDYSEIIGESLTIQRRGSTEGFFRISGVLEEIPDNSSLRFDMILPLQDNNEWNFGSVSTWLLLNENVNAGETATKVDQVLADTPEAVNFIRNGTTVLQPLSRVYYESVFGYTQTNWVYFLILGGLAFVILMVASINYISLTLSRVSGRRSEIGIRQVVGAQRSQIGRQFLGEVFITCLFAFMLAIVLAELLIPLLQSLVQKPVTLSFFSEPGLWILLPALLVVTTLVTGIYPAWVMSGRGSQAQFASKTHTERVPTFVKGLIAAQFTLSVALLIMAFVMQQQMNHLANSDPGFTATDVIEVHPGSNRIGRERQSEMADFLSREARGLAGVQSVSVSQQRLDAIPVILTSQAIRTALPGMDGFVDRRVADEYFLETLDIDLLMGDNFSQERRPDILDGVLINEAFAEVMGWNDPVGMVIEDVEDGQAWTLNNKRVIGVVENFQYSSFSRAVHPMVIEHPDAGNGGVYGTIAIKAAVGRIPGTIRGLQNLWDDMFPDEPFNYTLMAERLHTIYAEQERFSRVVQAASSVAILLAGFGLFGLASLVAQRRTREIGIRKVMGATVASVMLLLNRDFLKLVLIGFVVATPIAWYAMSRWLEEFTYKIEIGPGSFLLAGIAVICLTLATVSWQSVRAALANPVDAIRSE